MILLSPSDSESRSESLESRPESSVSGSTFGGGGLSRAPSIRRESQLSMQSTVEIQIETPQPAPRVADEYNPRNDGIKKSVSTTHCSFIIHISFFLFAKM